VVIEKGEITQRIPYVHDEEHTDPRHQAHIVILDHEENITYVTKS
jgi:hypothetical protein